MTTIDVEAAVRDRYTGASNACEAELCCPVEYSAELLAPIPAEVIERDYGCGDPSRYAQPGDSAAVAERSALWPARSWVQMERSSAST
jgi:hypothetical protein